MRDAKRIIITGGAGFIGSNIARRLDNGSNELLIIDDFRSGSFKNLQSPNRDWSYSGDLIAKSIKEIRLANIFKKFRPQVVFHQASITDTTVNAQKKMVYDNLESFRYITNLCIRYHASLIWASSAATYGTIEQAKPFELEKAGFPSNVYGFSKWLMENYHRRIVKRHPNFNIIGLRYFNVFGPGEQHKRKMASMIYKIIRDAIQDKPIRIFRDGNQARDFIYVDDVTDCCINAMQSANSGIYNVGTGSAITFNLIIKIIGEILNKELEPKYFDNPFGFFQNYTCADILTTKQYLNWEPSLDASEGIKKYIGILQSDTKSAS